MSPFAFFLTNVGAVAAVLGACAAVEAVLPLVARPPGRRPVCHANLRQLLHSLKRTLHRMNGPGSGHPWLMLMHQLPATPSNVRVKVWRRLQDLGAVALKSSVYALPNTDAAREDLEWVAQAIRQEGGEASLCEARLVEGLDDDALRALFTHAREADYRALAPEIRELARGALAVHIDRIGSAWLIRRLVDPQATFKFVAPRGYAPAAREVRFDMYEAEFTHDGDRCTFEVLLRAFALDDPALRALAEIVHDVDLKDAKFEREETRGFERVIAGIVRLHADDASRLRDGFVAFDALHAWFGHGRRRPRP